MSDVFIYFDLETTSSGQNSKIVQIGAVHQDGSEFQTFIVPDVDIHQGATKVNGFTKKDGKLYRHGNLVTNAVTPAKGLRDFLYWIENNSSNDGKRVCMIAHNGFRFDGPVLVKNFRDYNVTGIEAAISSLCDTQVCFKKNWSLPTTSLSGIMQHFGLREDNSHDGLQDARNLRKVVEAACRGRGMTLGQFATERRMLSSFQTKQATSSIRYI